MKNQNVQLPAASDSQREVLGKAASGRALAGPVLSQKHSQTDTEPQSSTAPL